MSIAEPSERIYIGVDIETLRDDDTALYDIINREYNIQRHDVSFQPEKNILKPHVAECLSSVLSNCYSEGRPGARYYGGCDNIDLIETLCEKRALNAFNVVDKCVVNVQAYSRSTANAAVMFGLLDIGDTILTLDIWSKGHPSMGVPKEDLSKWSRTEAGEDKRQLYDIHQYSMDSCFKINMDSVREKALSIKPKLIIVGCAATDTSFNGFRDIADSVGAKLLIDISDVSGLVACGVYPSPFDHADVVTTATDKTMRGPRGALVFMNTKRLTPNQIDSVNKGIFPGFQGGPHNASIAATCANLKDVQSAEFKEYILLLMRNKEKIVEWCKDKGYKTMSGASHTVYVHLSEEKVAKLRSDDSVDVGMYDSEWIRVSAAYLTTRSPDTDIYIYLDKMNNIIS